MSMADTISSDSDEQASAFARGDTIFAADD